MWERETKKKIEIHGRLQRRWSGTGRIGFSSFFAVESERARGKSAAQFLHGLLRFKVDLRAATASFSFDHRQPKKVNDQWSRGIGQTHLRFPSCETYETHSAQPLLDFCNFVIAFSMVRASDKTSRPGQPAKKQRKKGHVSTYNENGWHIEWTSRSTKKKCYPILLVLPEVFREKRKHNPEKKRDRYGRRTVQRDSDEGNLIEETITSRWQKKNKIPES